MSTDALAAPGPAAAPVCGCPIDADFPALRMVCAAPPIYVVENFLSAQQCVEMIEGSRPDLRESLAHNAGAHEGEEPPRTSSSVELGAEWSATLHALAERVTRQPAAHMEMPTLARYTAGQRYVAHHDAFPPGDPLCDPVRFGGNRIYTVLMYLNDVASGGRTTFHRVSTHATPGTT